MSERIAPPLLTVSNLSYRYGHGADRPLVLRNVSFQLYEGDIVVLTGPTGSGKSTLLSILGLLLRVQSGHVRIGGVDIGAADDSALLELRRRIRFVFQKSYLINSLTVLQNVLAALIVDPTSDAVWNDARAAEFLRHFGLGDVLHKWPDQLSGGQQQRVAVARALVGLPEILLADEPTASLDRDTANSVVEKIREIASKVGCGVILTTHDERIAHVATRRMLLRDGTIVEGMITEPVS
jgi:putative ABC transport system ATP-binding protein